MKTPLRWAGSKKALLPTLRTFWNCGRGRYIEPFCGSACLFFDLEPDEAVLGDINSELISTYRTLASRPSNVMECVLRWKPTEQNYYKLRTLDPFSLSEVELAARFLFLNRLCFNGIYRTNAAGKFNVPFGHPKSAVRFDTGVYLAASSLLKRATLVHGDFEEALADADTGDFVYLDPPYAVSSRRVFSEYRPEGFSEKDLKRLHALLHTLDGKGVKFVVSYADSAEGRRLVSDWNPKRVRTKRNIAGFAGHRRAAYEVLASNLERGECL